MLNWTIRTTDKYDRMYNRYEKKRILHLITIGDKRTQSKDVKFCSDYVKEILKGDKETNG